MKTNLRLLWSGIMLGMLLFTTNIMAQIDYSEDFEDVDNSSWSEDQDFYFDDTACSGSGVFVGNFYYYYDLFWETYEPAEAISSSIGTSSGGEVTLSYNYRLMDYNTEEALLNSPVWGDIVLQYGPSSSGPWTLIETITASNHTVSDNCAERTVTFIPPAGQQVYLRFYGDPSQDSDITDVVFYVDDIEATQAEPNACSGVPDDSAAIAASTHLCNGQEASLSLSPAYTDAGLSYQWQSSADGIDYDDVADADGITLMTEQTTTTYYRAVITCDASGESTTSEAVQVISLGIDCPCEMEFVYGVEPITLVQFAGIDNESDAEVDGSPEVEDFTDISPAEVELGETYEIVLEGNTNDPGENGYENYFTVYIDFNHNGSLNDDGEVFEVGTIIYSNGEDGIQATGEIMIPEDAMTGMATMRVVKHWYDEFDIYPGYLEEPCGDENTGYGQAEDYLINISAPAAPPVFDYYNLQWPANATISQGETATVYAQAWEPGVTPGAGPGEGVMAWVGVSTENTDPATWNEDSWADASYNDEYTGESNDEFMLDIGEGLAPGTYYYAVRWQLADGPYTYGGFQGAWGDEGVVNGVLTVNCAVILEPDVEMTTQTFCGEAEANDLEAEETLEDGELVWYDAETGGNMLGEDDELEDGVVYYVSQMVNGCESARVGITVEINITPEVDAESPQIFETNDPDMPLLVSLYEDVEVMAEGTITWYATEEDAEDGENALDPDTEGWVGDGTYYVTQTIDGCESEPVAVEIQTLLGTGSFAAGSFTYYPNPVKDVLTLSYTDALTRVEGFNMLGQKVLDVVPGQDTAHVDLSGLANGSYLIKVSAGDASKTIKVVKY